MCLYVFVWPWQVRDESLLTSLCNDVMTLVAAEAGGEVGRMFEYQLALLLGAVDSSSVTLFAQHCARRAVDYAAKVCPPPSFRVVQRRAAISATAEPALLLLYTFIQR